MSAPAPPATECPRARSSGCEQLLTDEDGGLTHRCKPEAIDHGELQDAHHQPEAVRQIDETEHHDDEVLDPYPKSSQGPLVDFSLIDQQCNLGFTREHLS